MTASVPHRHLWSLDRLSSTDLQALLDTAAALKLAKQRAEGWGPLRGRHLALLCSAADPSSAGAFQRAAHELGGSVALLDAGDWQAHAGAGVADAARLLGRLYDAVDCCDLPLALLEQIDAACGVPVFNGVAQANHPLSAMGALLTMREAGDKPLNRLHMCLAGDAETPVRHAAAMLARLAGVTVRERLVHAGNGHAPGAAADGTEFVFDPAAAPGAPGWLTMPEAAPAEQARIAALLAKNCQCALQALIVCGLQ
jgi:ornithine carbamoyltransferase